MLLATGLLAASNAGPAMADNIRDSQWTLVGYQADSAVWPVSQGEGVIVAVIDSGVLKEHVDLIGQVLPGADFSGENTDGTVDGSGHGTGMASLIAGHGHGSKAGVMGLAPKAKVLPIRLKWDEGDPALTQGVAKAIRFAVDHGAKVVNMSIGGFEGDDPDTRAAVKYAIDKDVVLVAATGNGGDRVEPVEYPAAFPGVVAVGAVDRNGLLWGKSTYGPETTLVAPGAEVPRASATSSAGYAIANGTSDSTAYVSATAALIRAKYPNLSAGQVINRMIRSATRPADASNLPNERYGYGILAPSKALEPNPVVDDGPRANPLVGRPESQRSAPPAVPAADEPWEEPVAGQGSGGNAGVAYTVTGAAGLVVAGGAVGAVLVVRGRRRRLG
ncbi:type VII secretion-associated serine protease mycosin [Streptomyces sp. BE20]|uniref:type VII secretion-associated serine protease mycosin n=1 Tax=Streptomyces sp. BE20 TaxID=3002525 RepID=UPI002E79D930|nr:type VII secretion-associated serine protease mycosin [Streptomyces sp. BE20]MEE1827437.1 type VII secretion-associated serine protease mycosin [Streptomyces sp. BE20]